MSGAWTLIPASAVYGVVAVLVFRRLADRAAIRRSFNRILAYVMELGLFLDTPALVFGAQRALLGENARLLRLVMVPAGILALVFALLFSPMDAIYGHDPLPVGEPAVVTVQMKDAAMPPVQLEAPPGVAVETPPVHVPADRQISWRVRPLRETSGDFKFRVENRVVTVGMDGFFLPDAAIRSVDIRRPKARIMGVSWLVWFIAMSCTSAAVFELFWKK